MINAHIRDSCRRFGLDYALVNALIATESGFNPCVIRYEPDYKWLYKIEECRRLLGCTLDTMINMQKTSWGLGQIMGAVAYEMGLKNWATKLLDPEMNIHFVCEYLKNIIDKHRPKDQKEVYAIYNAGSLRYKSNGDLVNQANVDRFMIKLTIVQKI